MIKCPECDSENLLVYEISAFYINTMEFFCHSSKAHDNDAQCRCLDCGWEGKRHHLNPGTEK